eukprot:TRINITY_DN18703_c0_g1::TRINITY_DN18703_c0_g1_i1::g.20493::m.20493 TRINITY_DN18703_c0_g1::TRINITY_DN18703_c0_g1_i1::g.20493  ORF type:complete len:424 (-),score=100.49,sp/Q3ZCC3/TRAF6_BOVIN/24.86/2e-08,zf-TRAF/PF02176.13/0.083,zf-TRAF/PF02176.13/6.9e-09,FliJ/PF02050.11/0.001,DUF773/PF05600.7/0.01,AAA_13/PF13166.1/1.5e+02,AAA_13/PF13166.1/0.018,IncA/PF04156.9/1.2e+03,IncA/PF04156.9/0.018,Laminin_I/PF06008.9/0.04,Myosin_tail_1/PF01576.14/0.034,APG6/PF04111.7/0.052,Filament/PF00038.16/0.096,Syntaxin
MSQENTPSTSNPISPQRSELDPEDFHSRMESISLHEPPQTQQQPPFNCDFLDVQAVEKTAHDLLKQLARAVCLSADQPSYTKEYIDAIRVDMEAFLLKEDFPTDFFGRRKRLDVPSALDVVMTKFTQKKKSFFRKVSSVITSSESREQELNDAFRTIARGNFWKDGERMLFAKALIRRHDIDSTIHCKLQFPDMESFQKHRMECPFRPLPCTNVGCGEVFSAHCMEMHDVECGFKVLSCRLSCGASVRRMDMDQHCTGPCPMMPVKCPFHVIGCTEPLVQGQFPQHIKDKLNDHLGMAVQQVLVQRAQIESLKEEVQDLKQKNVALLASSATLLPTVNALSEATKQAQKQVSDLSSNVYKEQQKLEGTTREHKTLSTTVINMQESIRCIVLGLTNAKIAIPPPGSKK